MVEFRRAGADEVAVFEVDGTYFFKHYFEEDAVFDRVKAYYNPQQYRFEVPPEEFEDLQAFLRERGYDLVVRDSLAECVVVVKQYTAHPENIFKASVTQRSADGYNFFLMTGREAVERAEAEGAVPLEKTSLPNPFAE